MKKNIFSVSLVMIILLSSCQHPQTAEDKRIEFKVDSVMRMMTLDEEIGQMVLYSSDWDVTGPSLKKGYMDEIRKGNCGNIFNAHTVA